MLRYDCGLTLCDTEISEDTVPDPMPVVAEIPLL